MKESKGFTLVELMIVVAIIAILAAVAIPQYKKFQLKSKTSEGKSNLGAIKTCEETFAAEHDVYAVCSAAPTGVTPGTTKHAWAVATAKQGFDLIGFKPAGNVYYVYGVSDATNVPSNHDATQCSTDTSIDTNSGAIQNGVSITTGTDIYIMATGDLDGDSTKASFYITDEDNKVVADPVDAGQNTF
jgi:type IV pilus assembly protein PilA